ncbi:MAG: multiheme c-type cytochrome [Thiobacillus sp.]|nr:multiheme c-type cytochrome [Thiobacillus sp.]MDP2977422.1 multiheme c-type cytochrome [Thiobacillus sp.]
MSTSSRPKMARYAWGVLVVTVLAIAAGYVWVAWSKGGPGDGLYSRLWQPDKVFGYWHPARFYDYDGDMSGRFEGPQCVECHDALTPGIVADWRASSHAAPKDGKTVYCDSCHGNDHAKLRMPDKTVCGGCHAAQHAQFQDERRFGFPSHALAIERAVDAPHFVDKPKAEVTACLQCHSVASKCDSCHTRHLFSAAEARRPEACITCHSGPPHPDDETFFASAHGKRYLAEGDQWDWSKPLAKGNYKAPTCAYCHMSGGKHQVADKTIWKFGLQEVNPLTSGNQVRRKQWVAVCSDCHDAEWSRQQLAGLDAERKRAWPLLYAAERELKGLRSDGLLHPTADERPPYPLDKPGALFARERIGFFEGQSSAFYNVSPIERDYFEMWYFDNLGAYKGAAHGAPDAVARGHEKMNTALENIKQKAQTLRQQGKPPAAGLWWVEGEYTSYNKEHN